MQTVQPNDRASFNSYDAHEWSAAIDNEVFWSHTIKVEDGAHQTFYMDFGEDDEAVPDKDELWIIKKKNIEKIEKNYWLSWW